MAAKIHILMLEAIESDALLIEEELRKAGLEFIIRRVSSEQDFKHIIDHEHPNLVLSDYLLPEYDGISALDYVLSRGGSLPFIFVSDAVAGEFAIEMLKRGATDFVVKQRLSRLVPAVRRALNECGKQHDRRAAQPASNDVESRYRALLKAIPDMILRINRDGDILDFTPARFFDTQLASLQLTDKNLFEQAANNALAKLLQQKALRAFAIRDISVEEFQLQDADYLVDIEIRAVFSDNDSVLLIVRDIHDRKVAESVLIEAKERAEEMNRIKSNLLANLNHEFRTPMNAILGFTSLLNSGTDDPEQHMYAQMLHKSAERLMHSLNNIIILAELQSGSLLLDSSLFRLDDELREITSYYQEVAAEKGLKLLTETNCDTEDLYIRIDPALFRIVINNLLSNAIKFTEEGSIVVTIDRLENDGKPLARISVRDSGIGIVEDFLPHAFDEFRQQSEGISRNYEGIGIGLSVVHKLTKKMGGTVEVKSERNSGATFSLTYPLVTKAGKQHLLIDSWATTDKDYQEPRAELSLLIVEDDSITRELMTEYLARFGTIDHARDGESALSMCRSNPFDVILLDINLGNSKMDGVETFKAIRRLPAHTATPVIAVTAYARQKHRRELLQAGFTDYLAKPFQAEDLQRLLTKYTSNQ